MKDRIYKKPYKPDYTTDNARKLRKKSTPAEKKLWKYLKNRNFMGLKFRRQVPFGRYILDFYCKEKNLVIEIDGEYHSGQKEYDRKREELLHMGKMRIYRFSNDEVLHNTEIVLNAIEEVII